MADQVKNLMIGLFVIAAAAVVIFILMFLHPRIGDEGQIIHVRFTDVDKITVGTRVTYAGKPVGEVIGISEIDEGRGGKTDSAGRVYIYDLILQVDSKVKVFNTDEIAPRTSGLLGEKNIDITPIAAQPGQELIEIDGKIIYSEQTGSVEETFKEFKEAADKLQSTLDVMHEILDQVISNKLVDKITIVVENIESITEAVNDKLVGKLVIIAENVESITDGLNKPEEISEFIQNVHKFSNSLNDSWISVDKFIKDIDDAALSITKFVHSGQVIFEDVSSGKGTFGKFFGNDDVYLRTSSIMSKMETILDDINHYGLLFQSDKGWQRLRARRMNLLQKLSTPQEFRNYFNDEVNQISTSLSRVYMVLNEVENDPCNCDVMQDREFTKVFSELMRRVTMLEEEIRMYNTQIVESQVHVTELGNPPCYIQPSQKTVNCFDPCANSYLGY
ncbi:MAG TPA: MlaD family protein [Parachlamydiaceae bacterium]|nr:MlaD family protein [Parachlamydiaceae bacterium]